MKISGHSNVLKSTYKKKRQEQILPLKIQKTCQKKRQYPTPPLLVLITVGVTLYLVLNNLSLVHCR